MCIVAPAVAGLLFTRFGEKGRYQESINIFDAFVFAVCSKTVVRQRSQRRDQPRSHAQDKGGCLRRYAFDSCLDS